MVRWTTLPLISAKIEGRWLQVNRRDERAAAHPAKTSLMCYLPLQTPLLFPQPHLLSPLLTLPTLQFPLPPYPAPHLAAGPQLHRALTPVAPPPVHLNPSDLLLNPFTQTMAPQAQSWKPRRLPARKFSLSVCSFFCVFKQRRDKSPQWRSPPLEEFPQ